MYADKRQGNFISLRLITPNRNDRDINGDLAISSLANRMHQSKTQRINTQTCINRRSLVELD